MRRPTIAFVHLGQVHDEFPDIERALTGIGVGSAAIHLVDSEAVDWGAYAAVNLRECRGYHLDDRFLSRLEELGSRIAPADFVNPLAIVRGALDKSAYLPALAAAGVELVPTRWVSALEFWTADTLFRDSGWPDLVAKPGISSKSWRTFRLSRAVDGIDLWRPGPPALPERLTLDECEVRLREAFAERSFCVQRYMPEIETRGELSFVFLGGALSHAVRKTAASGGWLAHEFYGGSNALSSVTASEASWACRVHELLEHRFGRLHYARIDALPDRGRWLLLECELIVPRLFLREARAVDRYAALLASGLGAG